MQVPNIEDKLRCAESADKYVVFIGDSQAHLRSAQSFIVGYHYTKITVVHESVHAFVRGFSGGRVTPTLWSPL